MHRQSVLALLLLAVLSGCASGLRRPATSIDAVTDAKGVQRVDVDLHSYYFKPNRIVVHSGLPVVLKLRNRAVVVPHNFTLADTSLHVNVSKWGFGSAEARFTPQAPGEYRFYCHVDSHGRKKGMTGTLVVVP